MDNLFSVIVSVVSIVLAVVSILLSWLFFSLSKKDSEAVSRSASKIENNTDVLNSLFNKMFDTSFKMIERQSLAMQNQLFNSKGTTESVNSITIDLDIMSYLKKKRDGYNFNEISTKFNLDNSKTKAIIDRLSEKGLVKIDGDKICYTQDPVGDVESSE